MNAAIVEWQEQGTNESAKKLLAHCAGLIHREVNRLLPVLRDDGYAEVCAAVLGVAKKFDPSKGQFLSWAAWGIKAGGQAAEQALGPIRVPAGARVSGQKGPGTTLLEEDMDGLTAHQDADTAFGLDVADWLDGLPWLDRQVAELLLAGESQVAAANILGLTRSHVRAIVAGLQAKIRETHLLNGSAPPL